jgi:hypothetical protein
METLEVVHDNDDIESAVSKKKAMKLFRVKIIPILP